MDVVAAGPDPRPENLRKITPLSYVLAAWRSQLLTAWGWLGRLPKAWVSAPKCLVLALKACALPLKAWGLSLALKALALARKA